MKINEAKEKYNFLLKKIRELRKTLTVKQIEIEFDFKPRYIDSFLDSRFSSDWRFLNKLNFLFDKMK